MVLGFCYLSLKVRVLAVHHNASGLVFFLGANGTQFPRINVTRSEHRQSAISVFWRHDSNHANTHVEGLFHLLQANLPEGRNGAEYSSRGPLRTVYFCYQAFRKNAL